MKHFHGEQRRKAFALWPWGLVGFCLLASGALSRWLDTRAAVAPQACAKPVQRDGVLRCDGAGVPLVHQAWLVGQPLDVNLATQTDLQALPKIGPAMAKSIVALRDSRGGFQALHELREVSGIGEKTYLRIRPYLRVGRKSMLHRP